ncbi:MAG: DUF6665 family protein [Devosia sp.]
MALTALDIAELRQRLQTGFGPIEAEVMGEKASSLGHHGRQVEKTIAALREFKGTDEARVVVVKEAARAVWKYFVQREACGMRNHKDAIALYGIPGEVLVRLGASE